VRPTNPKRHHHSSRRVRRSTHSAETAALRRNDNGTINRRGSIACAICSVQFSRGAGPLRSLSIKALCCGLIGTSD